MPVAQAKHRLLLNCLAALSALLATLLWCGYLVTVRLDASVTPVTRQIGFAVDLENGRMMLEAGGNRYFLRSPWPQQTSRFDFHGRLEPYFVSVAKRYWWGWTCQYDKRTGRLGIGPQVLFIAPIWSAAFPVTMFPLIYFGQKLRNRAGGFPVIMQSSETQVFTNR